MVPQQQVMPTTATYQQPYAAAFAQQPAAAASTSPNHPYAAQWAAYYAAQGQTQPVAAGIIICPLLPPPCLAVA